MTIDLEALYTDLHRHPELSFQETRTAGVVTGLLAQLGIEYEEGIGRTGIAAIIRNGDGPVVWLRADMDGLPVEERTGLAYASTARGVDPAGLDVPVMHACGHDMHVASLIGALERLVATKDEWSGTIVAVFQPAEEYGAGSQAMIADGVLDRFPRPDIVLGQHVTPLPAATIGVRSVTQMAASDGLTVTLHGRGG
ncbi:MAG: amidohydrolase, partial [Microbacterium chocolatum]|nr:amidohydrolase [Microbacterium chocolatum]